MKPAPDERQRPVRGPVDDPERQHRAVDVGRDERPGERGVLRPSSKAQSWATGASFTGVTVSDTVATFESSEPSFAT